MADNIRFLYGEDDYRRSQRVRFYKDAFAKKYPDGEINIMEASASLEDVRMAALTPNLFGGKRLVLLDQFWDSDKFDAAAECGFWNDVADMEDMVTVIMIEKTLDKRTKWAKGLLKGTYMTEAFDTLDEAEIVRWVIQYTQKNGGTILQKDAQYMVHRCGVDLWHLSHEIDKMIMSGDASINKETIDTQALPRPAAVIWDFLESVSKRQAEVAFVQLHKLIAAGESMYQILAMMMREARIHAQLRYGAEQGMDNKTLATVTKLHPFVVQKTVALSRRFSAKKIEELYDGLWALDKDIKTGGVAMTTDDTSELELGMEKIIYTLCKD